jgi:hypothetical protein
MQDSAEVTELQEKLLNLGRTLAVRSAPLSSVAQCNRNCRPPGASPIQLHQNESCPIAF